MEIDEPDPAGFKILSIANMNRRKSTDD